MNQCPKTDCKKCGQCKPKDVKAFSRAAKATMKQENKKLRG